MYDDELEKTDKTASTVWPSRRRVAKRNRDGSRGDRQSIGHQKVVDENQKVADKKIVWHDEEEEERV